MKIKFNPLDLRRFERLYNFSPLTLSAEVNIIPKEKQNKTRKQTHQSINQNKQTNKQSSSNTIEKSCNMQGKEKKLLHAL